VDEQHRFGVEQRKALTEGRSPHVLHMTATPIPRTLALTVYGDLAVSEITRPPADRKPIKTAWVAEDRSAAAYSRLRKHLDAGRQAYVVCPLIEESETTQARAAEAEAERLQSAELRGYRVGLLHGRLRPADRRELMARFKARAEVDLDIRGSGQLLGTRQSGLTDLRFAHLRKDRPLLERARVLADELVDAGGPLSDEVERAFADGDLSAA